MKKDVRGMFGGLRPMASLGMARAAVDNQARIVYRVAEMRQPGPDQVNLAVQAQRLRRASEVLGTLGEIQGHRRKRPAALESLRNPDSCMAQEDQAAILGYVLEIETLLGILQQEPTLQDQRDLWGPVRLVVAQGPNNWNMIPTHLPSGTIVWVAPDNGSGPTAVNPEDEVA